MSALPQKANADSRWSNVDKSHKRTWRRWIIRLFAFDGATAVVGALRPKSQSCIQQFTRQFPLPFFVLRKADGDDAGDIGGNLNSVLEERANAASPELGHEVTHLHDDILAGPRSQFCRTAGFGSTGVVGCKKDDRKSDISIIFELLKNCTPSIRLISQNDGLKTFRLQERFHSGLRFVVVTMRHKHLFGIAGLRKRACRSRKSHPCRFAP